MSPIDTWLDEAAKKDNVKGVIIIDNTSGLSLGVRGVAKHSHAPLLKRFVDNSSESSTKAIIDDFVVYLTTMESAILGVYMAQHEESTE